MPNSIRLASYRPTGQGEAGYEMATFRLNCPGYHLYHRDFSGVGDAAGPLRGPLPDKPDGGYCFYSMRI